MNNHCFSCGKTFRNPSDLERHKRRKTPCLIQDIPENDTEQFRCKFCNKAYKRAKTLSKHYKLCKIKNGGMEILAEKVKNDEKNIKILEEKNMNDALLELIKSQNETNKLLREELETIKKQLVKMPMTNSNNSNSNNTNTNSHNTIQNNIVINSYKSPNTENLSLTMKDIDSHTKIAYALLNKIYFNPELPENHSIYLLNKKDKTLMVYLDKWRTLTSENDRKSLIVELQNVIIQKGAKIVNSLYGGDEGFLKLPKDLAERIINYNGCEPQEVKMNEKSLLEYAVKHKPMIKDTMFIADSKKMLK